MRPLVLLCAALGISGVALAEEAADAGAADAPTVQTETPDAGAPAPKKKKEVPPLRPGDTVGYQELGFWWDLNLEGGGGFWVEPGRPLFGMGRARVGGMLMLEPWYFSAGATYEYSSFSPAAFGLQLEALHLWTGYWVQLGGMANIDGRLGGQGAIGFSVVGLEAEVWNQAGGGTRLVALLKLRIPISWLFQIGKPPRLPTLQPDGSLKQGR